MAEALDLLIIGAGPAGLSAAHAAAQAGLSYLVLEKGTIADTIRKYPVGRTLFSTPNELEMFPGALEPCREKPSREELLSHYIHFVLDHDLNINTDEEVLDVENLESQGFRVHTNKNQYSAARILFAIGAMARPRWLNIPGEDLPKVQHLFVEPYAYIRKDAMVVGGGNSAAEAALFLSEEGARTTLVIWREDWENTDPKAGAMKHWVRKPLDHEVAAGRLRVVLYDQVLSITEREVTLTTEDGETLSLPNDVLFVLIGSDADLTLLKKLGVKTESGKLTEMPVYDPETFETNVRGVYVVGHFTHARHIKAAIDVPRQVVPLIAKGLHAENSLK
ncbi:MAG TPA: NAD(P)-binding domain-containing protein [Pyrinomonadaceae bacterium]|jgi:putative YpdA family bacillithiol system oxidoreductase|nr:NAD(P)-binding domain-containing protein [Pyrinomonadaceae bacterium]